MAGQQDERVDALVVGAGFGGIYALYKLKKELGLEKVVLIEKDPDVGGVWYKNCYPGAMSDSDAVSYRFGFDEEFLKTNKFEHTYVFQKEIKDYFDSVIDYYDLRKHIKLSTEMTSAEWNEADACWDVRTDKLPLQKARYLVTALGFLSAINWPNFKNMDKFKGKLIHSSQWPQDYSIEGKRVGIIGSGSTGVQLVQGVGPKVGHLVSFQRTPQFITPARVRKITPEERAEIDKNWAKLFEVGKNHAIGLSYPESTDNYADVDEDERQRRFEKAWEEGGAFRFLLQPFQDTISNREANLGNAAFITKKLTEKITDPEKRRKLIPTGLNNRRPICADTYFDVFNQDNVDIVLLKETPITEFTEKGIKTSDGKEYELDVVCFATGYDAVDGNYNRLKIVGKNGITLKEQWGKKLESYLGVFVQNFPNLFTINGPLSSFTNIPPVVETQGDLIGDVIKRSQDLKKPVIEVEEAAVKKWSETATQVSDALLFKESPTSWVYGGNVEGRVPHVKFFLGGLKNFRAEIKRAIDAGYDGIQFS